MNWGPRQRDSLPEVWNMFTTSSVASHQQAVTTSTTSRSEPVIGSQTSAGPAASSTGAVTTNGQCGATNNGTVCGNWHLGSCCSMYGCIPMTRTLSECHADPFSLDIAATRQLTAGKVVNLDHANLCQLRLLQVQSRPL